MALLLVFDSVDQCCFIFFFLLISLEVLLYVTSSANCVESLEIRPTSPCPEEFAAGGGGSCVFQLKDKCVFLLILFRSKEAELHGY